MITVMKRSRLLNISSEDDDDFVPAPTHRPNQIIKSRRCSVVLEKSCRGMPSSKKRKLPPTPQKEPSPDDSLLIRNSMVSKSASQSKNLVVIGRTPSQGDLILDPGTEKNGDIAPAVGEFKETTSDAKPGIEEGKSDPECKPRGRSRGRQRKEEGTKGNKPEKSVAVNGKKRRPGRPRKSSTEGDSATSSGKQGGKRKGRSAVVVIRRKSVSNESKVSSTGDTASITTSEAHSWSEEGSKKDGEEVYCHICNKNLTGTTIARQERHINKLVL